MGSRALQSGLAIAAATWAIAIVGAPEGISQGQATGVAAACSAVVYAIGSVICHQRPERSFHVWGEQMPVCARCAGLYLGAAIVALHVLMTLPKGIGGWDAARARRLLVVAAIPTAVTLFVEWATGTVPPNWARAVSALPLGAIVARLLLGEAAPSRSAVEVN